jgi:hypothetical protein
MIARHVAEQQILVLCVPERPFGEQEASGEPLDLRSIADD